MHIFLFLRNYTNPKIDEYMKNNNLNEFESDVIIKKGDKLIAILRKK